MDILTLLISRVNDVLWTYILIIMLLGCAFWFTFKTNFVQFRMIREMIRLLGDSTGKTEGREHHISSFQAFAVSIASRVGTGNLAGVATAITLGGPGAVFWMWVIALFGASSAFIESTLAQLYKVHGHNSFVGGPAYYMKKGLKQPWMGVLFAFLLIFTFGFAFNSVQSNTICAAFEEAFNIPPSLMGVILTSLTLIIIFGGIQRIAKVSSIIVPVMALGYIFLSLFIVIVNAKHLPEVIELIIANAFGWEQALSGGIGMALMQGIKRGLFSNEAGMGSTPHAHALANVKCPHDQGVVAMIGVFIDTFVVLTLNALVIISTLYTEGGPLHECGAAAASTTLGKANLAQTAFGVVFGETAGNMFVAVCLFFFAFSTILGWNLFGKINVAYLFGKKSVIVYTILALIFIFLGTMMANDLVWELSDMFNNLMVIPNVIALFALTNLVVKHADDPNRIPGKK